MLIDFEELPRTVNERFKGGEGKVNIRAFADDNARIMKVTIEPNSSIGLHKHEDNSEIVFIVSGRGRMVTDGAAEELRAGMCSYCPRGSEHTLINAGEDELVLFAVIPQHN